MNDLDALLEKIREDTEDRLRLLQAKNADYSKANHVTSNFEAIAESLDVPVPVIFMALASKHWRALCKWAAGTSDLRTNKLSELTRDVHNYLDLMEWWVDRLGDKVPRREFEDDLSLPPGIVKVGHEIPCDWVTCQVHNGLKETCDYEGCDSIAVYKDVRLRGNFHTCPKHKCDLCEAL